MKRWKLARIGFAAIVLAAVVTMAPTPKKARASGAPVTLDNGVIKMELNGQLGANNYPMITSMWITGVQVVPNNGAGADAQFTGRCAGCPIGTFTGLPDGNMWNPTLGGDCNGNPSQLEPGTMKSYSAPNVGIPFVNAPLATNGQQMTVQPRNYNQPTGDPNCPGDGALMPMDFNLGVSLGDGRSGALPSQVAILDMGMKLHANSPYPINKASSEMPTLYPFTDRLPYAWYSTDGHSWTPFIGCSLAGSDLTVCDSWDQYHPDCGGHLATNDVRKYPLDGPAVGGNLNVKAVALSQSCGFPQGDGVGLAVYSHQTAVTGGVSLRGAASGQVTAFGITGAQNGSQGTIDPPKNDLLGQYTTLRRLLVVGNVGTISAAISQSEGLIRDWGNW